MNNKKHGFIAPIVITALTVIYLIAYFCAIIYVLDGVARVLVGLIPVAMAAAMIYVCIRRIHEIEKGEDDDLSNY